MKSEAELKDKKIVGLANQLEESLADNQRLHEELKRSQEIIEDQIMEIDDSDPAQDPNLLVGIHQEKEKNEKIIASLNEQVKGLSDQLSMAKKDLELEKARKLHDFSDVGSNLDSHRKLSDETQQLLQKLSESPFHMLDKEENRSRKGSLFSPELLPILTSRNLESFPSQLVIAGTEPGSSKIDVVRADSSVQTEETYWSEINAEAEKTEPTIKIVYTEREIVCIVAFKPLPAFDFKSVLVEEASFEDPKARLRFQKLATANFSFGMSSALQTLSTDRAGSGKGDLPTSRKLTEEEDKPSQRFIIWPQFALQVEEIDAWSKPEEPQKSLRATKRMNFTVASPVLFSEASQSITHGIPADASFERQASKASFLRLDLDKGVLRESDHLPFAHDQTAINIRKILGIKSSNRVSRHKLVPVKDVTASDVGGLHHNGNTVFAKSNVDNPYFEAAHNDRLDQSHISQTSFIDLKDGGMERSATQRDIQANFDDESSPWQMNLRSLNPSKSALAMRDADNDAFKDKKRKLNTFFKQKTEQKDKNRRPV